MLLFLGGIAGVLHSWMHSLKERERKIEEFLFFFQKSIGVMETEKVRVMDYFKSYASKQVRNSHTEGVLLKKILIEIATRLSSNTYPSGQMVWEEVLLEEKEYLGLDNESFLLLLQAGNGFFGRSREENIRFLEKSVNELEKQQKQMKEKHRKERKVWIPVGMLGAVMLAILFI